MSEQAFQPEYTGYIPMGPEELTERFDQFREAIMALEESNQDPHLTAWSQAAMEDLDDIEFPQFTDVVLDFLETRMRSDDTEALNQYEAVQLFWRAIQQQVRRLDERYPAPYLRKVAWQTTHRDIFKERRTVTRTQNEFDSNLEPFTISTTFYPKDEIEENLGWRVIQSNEPGRYDVAKIGLALLPAELRRSLKSVVVIDWASSAMLGPKSWAADMRLHQPTIIAEPVVRNALEAVLDGHVRLERCYGIDQFILDEPTLEWIEDNSHYPREWSEVSTNIQRVMLHIREFANVRYHMANILNPHDIANFEQETGGTKAHLSISIAFMTYLRKAGQRRIALEHIRRNTHPEGIVLIGDWAKLSETGELVFDQNIHDNDARFNYFVQFMADPNRKWVHIATASSGRVETITPSAYLSKVALSGNLALPEGFAD